MRRLALPLLVGLAVLSACEDEPTSTRTVELPTGREGLPATPDQVVENGQHVITVDGVKKAVIEAEQMYFFHELGRVIGDTISVRFFDENGVQQSLLTALTGEIDQETQEMLAEGEVHVRGETSRIVTEELQYHPERNLVTSDTTTEIHQDGNVIRGQGVESDPGLKNLKIRGASAVIRNEAPLQGPAQADTTGAAAAPPDVRDGDTEDAAGADAPPPDPSAGGGDEPPDPEAAEEETPPGETSEEGGEPAGAAGVAASGDSL